MGFREVSTHMENLAAVYGSVRDLLKSQRTESGLRKAQREAELLEELCHKALTREQVSGSVKEQIQNLRSYARNVMQGIDLGDTETLRDLKVHISDRGSVQQYPTLKMASRVAQRYVTAMGVGLSDDLLKSLNSLAKNNQGLWKSEKQAAYLLRILDTESKTTTPDVTAWVKRQPWYAAGQIIVENIRKLEGYGHRDISKVRYAGQVFVADGAGIVARMKGNVKHPRQDDPSSMFIIPTTLEATFIRDPGIVPLVKFDLQKAKEQEAQALRQQVVLNQKLIDQIKKIPKWDQQTIFKDFVAILEAGRTLTPGQLQVVKKNLPEAEIDFGDPAEWLRLQQENIQMIEDQIVRPALHEMDSKKKLLAASVWGKFKKNPKNWSSLFEFHHGDENKWDFGSAIDWATQVGTEPLRYPDPSSRMLIGTWDQVNRAIRAVKSNKAPTKKSLEMLKYIKKLNNKLKTTSVNNFKGYI